MANKPTKPKKPEMARFKTYYAVPETLPVLDDQVDTILNSFSSVTREEVMQRLAVLVFAIIERVERSIYDPTIGCAIYRKACQALSERDIDPWDLAQGNAIDEAFHQDAYDGLPGVDEYAPYTSLALIKLLARAVIDAQAVAREMLSGAFFTYNRERVTMAGLLSDERFIPYLEGVLERWKWPDPPTHVLSALGQIRTAKAVEVASRYLTGDDDWTVAAIESLEYASTPEALDALTLFKSVGDYPPMLDVAIANVSEGVQGLLRMAKAPDPNVRASAVDRLGGVKEPTAVQALGDALEDNTPIEAFTGDKGYTVAEVACYALDYYGLAYLRKILPDTVIAQYRKTARKLKRQRRDGYGYGTF